MGDLGRVQAGDGDVVGACRRQRFGEAVGVVVDEGEIQYPGGLAMGQQRVEQGDVGTGRKRQMQVGDVAAIGASGIDDHHGGAAILAGFFQPLEQHRVAPSQVGPHQHHQIGQFDVFIAAGHGVGAESAAVAGHGRRHAQPRIGVDVGGAQEALGQLVGGVIILGQQLAGQVEGE